MPLGTPAYWQLVGDVVLVKLFDAGNSVAHVPVVVMPVDGEEEMVQLEGEGVLAGWLTVKVTVLPETAAAMLGAVMVAAVALALGVPLTAPVQ